MKALRWAIPCICAVGLASCATTDASSYRSADAGTQGKFVDDDAYIAAVEHMASRSGVRVHWVNPPSKRVDKD